MIPVKSKSRSSEVALQPHTAIGLSTRLLLRWVDGHSRNHFPLRDGPSVRLANAEPDRCAGNAAFEPLTCAWNAGPIHLEEMLEQSDRPHDTST